MLSIPLQYDSGEEESDAEEEKLKGKSSAQRDARLRKKRKLALNEYVLPLSNSNVTRERP